MLTGVYADWFVGGVACSLGLVILVAVWAGHPRVFELAKVRFSEQQIGRAGTKLVLYLIGIALIALGIAICSGWKIHSDEQPLSQTTRNHSARSV